MRWGLYAGIVIATFVVRVSSASAGNFMNGNQLHSECPESATFFAQGDCAGYIAGIADAMDRGNAVNGFKACIPNEVTRGEINDVVVKYLQDHPEWRHYAAAGLVAQALQEAFPCSP